MKALIAFFAAQSWYDLTMFAFAAFVLPAMSVVAGRQLARSEQASLVPRYWFTLARGMLAALAVLAVWYCAGRPFAKLGLDFPISIRGEWGFLIVAVVAVVAWFQIARVKKLSGDKLDKAMVTLKRIKIVPRTHAELILFLAVAVNAGIWEELFYRGFLIWFLTPLAGVAAAVVMSSALFGIGHIYQGWRGVLMTGFVGLVLGILYVLTASLWWVMAVHALIDIYGGLVSYRISRRAAEIHQADKGLVNAP
jgi:membrane protease YdiL (CAAX protease family)